MTTIFNWSEPKPSYRYPKIVICETMRFERTYYDFFVRNLKRRWGWDILCTRDSDEFYENIVVFNAYKQEPHKLAALMYIANIY